jgi:exopolyphosphatase/guanosine-5'-triphosphate,3'-diphosphate pyrophosphatase
LLVAERTSLGYRDLERRLTFTRLGQGVDANATLAAVAIERTLRAVAEFCAVAGELGASERRVVGTSALRDAANRDEFLHSAASMTGAQVEVIDGEKEAELSFLGATADMAPGIYLVCDIGGGSTEFVLGATPPAPGGLNRISLDIGSVRLTERFITTDPASSGALARLESAVDAALQEALDRLPGAGRARFAGVAGTVTSLAAIRAGLDHYDPKLTHGMVLEQNEVEGLYRRLAAMELDERQAFPSLPPGRADVIVAGAAILVRAMAAWGFGEVIVSEKDILDGLVLEMFETAEKRER